MADVSSIASSFRALLGRTDGGNRLTRAQLEEQLLPLVDALDRIADEEPAPEASAPPPETRTSPAPAPEGVWSSGPCSRCRRDGMLLDGVCAPGNGCSA